MRPHIILASFLLAASVHAQPVSVRLSAVAPTDSLEWMVLDSPAVVRATPTANTPDVLSIIVTESIKGTYPVGTPLSLPAPAFRPSPTNRDLLVFLTKDQPDKFDIRQPQIGFFRDLSAPIRLMDFRELTSPKEILAAAREAAAFSPAEKITNLTLVSGRRTSAQPIYLTVPIDSRLEKLGRQWAAQSDFDKRMLAIQALTPFKSKQNIEAVMPLLDDTRSDFAVSFGKWKMGFYHVRVAAMELLRDWGVNPPPLLMSGPILVYHPTTTAKFVWPPAIILLWLVICYVGSWWSRKFFAAFSWSILILAIALAAGGGWLWVRSISTVDELMFASGSSHYEISSFNGGLQCLVLREWESASPTVMGHFDRSLAEDWWTVEKMNPTFLKKTIGFAIARGWTKAPGPTTHPFLMLRLPWWALIIPLLLISGRAMVKASRPILRKRRGLCGQCGYDLRESPSGQCPECGAPNAARAAAQLAQV